MNKTNYKKCKIETSVADLIKPKKNYQYECFCIRCGGKKVDPRTQKRHATERFLWKSEDDRKNQEDAVMARKKKNTNLISTSKSISNKSKKRKRDEPNSSKPNKEATPTDSFPDSFPDVFPDVFPGVFPGSFSDSFQQNNEENMHTSFSSNFHTALDNGISKENNQYYIQLDEEDKGDEDDEDEEDEDDEDEVDEDEDDEVDENEDDEDEEDDDEDEDDEDEDDEDEDDDIEDLFPSPEIDDEVFVMESLNDSYSPNPIFALLARSRKHMSQAKVRKRKRRAA
jgi:hypothetical protein